MKVLTLYLPEHPLFATPYENSLILAVSCLPVNLFSLSSPYTAMCSACLAPSLSMAWMILFNPPLPFFSGTLISSVEKLMCMPAPFQSPCISSVRKGRRARLRWGEERKGEVRRGKVRWGRVREGEEGWDEVRWGKGRRGEERWGRVRWGKGWRGGERRG